MRHGGLLALVVLAACATTAPSQPELRQVLGAWTPAEAATMDAASADFVVDPEGRGTHRTVQAAVDAVPGASAATKRWVIAIKPGTYREPLCVKDKAPLLLRGEITRPVAVRIVEGRYNSLPKAADAPAHPCVPASGAATHGTSGSTSVAVFSDDVQLAHLTIANDATEGPLAAAAVARSGGAQAVALTTAGDRIQLHDVRLWSHQDTFYVRRREAALPGRVFVRDSLIAGDVDFVFGNATLVIDRSTLLSRAGRRSGEAAGGGIVLAPSTLPDQPFGFLVTNSRFVAEAGVAGGSVALGRAWDQGVPAGSWKPGVSPNGQALVRDSSFGPHIAPWTASTSRRPFTAQGEQANRLVETGNRALPADPARETLRADDGWAAGEGGTHGGAGAAPADVFEVRNRRELAAALAGPQRPRIVKLRGRIDLSVDDDGKPLGADDYRDPAFNWDAFARAYDPATWGKREPEGALEEARRRSAKRQAERIVLRVPSDTTLVGMGKDAAVVNGMLLLERVDNVIVRNIHFSDAYDHFPAWDPNDNANGEWNSEYDNLSLRDATHVWVDHCSFDDGNRPDAAEPVLLGRRMQRHDGLLDITRLSNFVTVSWNHLRRHDKTTLVGSSDKAVADEGRLKVTFHHNLWDDVKERAPRVRYGQVHLFNNLHVVSAEAAGNFGYSIGVGLQSRIFSEQNVWETPPGPPGVAATKLLRVLKGQTFFDRGSLHNGQPVNLVGALALTPDIGWRPVLHGAIDNAADVPARVRAGAGAGKAQGLSD